jgi:endonuclease YncB( thermonuclease family)
MVRTPRSDGKRVRLAGIDAPELPGPRLPPGDPYACTDNLEKLVTASPVICE